MTSLVLASGSPWRRQLLERLQLPFIWQSPDIDETPREHETPQALVRRLALSKASQLTEQYPQHLLIGSDQVASFDEEILGKPGTTEQAIAMLERFSGRQVRFVTGLALLNSTSGRHWIHHEEYRVVFRRLSRGEIENYVAREQPLDSAGSFRMEGLGIALFERLEGDDPSSLIGLPLIQLCQMLREAGLDPLA